MQASEPGLLRPGTWIAPEVHVEGSVLLPPSISREIARVPSGEAVWTVTSGPMAWSRTQQLPPGWALTEARVISVGWGYCREDGCSPQPQGVCPALGLGYRDLGAVHDGRLHLSVASEDCLGQEATDATRSEPFRAGPFSGRIEEGPLPSGMMGTRGTVSDGVTRVDFQTDVPPADMVPTLSSLVPFDVTSGPASPDPTPPDGG